MTSLTALFGMETLAPAKARALSIVYAASITLMMGVNFIQPALPALSQPFGITDAQLSWIMTLFTAPAIVLSPIFGVIADLYGRRLLLGLGLIVFGIFGAAMAFAPTFGWLLVFRSLQGVGFSAVIPLTIVLIGDLLEGDNEISGQGLKVFLDRIGYFIFPPLGGLLATIAWFWPFACYILAVPVGLIALVWMPETKGKSGERDYGVSRRHVPAGAPSAAGHRVLGRFSALLSRLRFSHLLSAFSRAHAKCFDGNGGIALYLFFDRRDADFESSRAHRRGPR